MIKLSDLTKKYGSDIALEQNGVWIEVEGVRWKVKRLNFRNGTWIEKLNSESTEGFNDSNTEEKAKRIYEAHQRNAESCILDWDNVTDDDGNKIPFSMEAVLNFFKLVPDYADKVFAEADKRQHFQKEEDLKNLLNTSSGNLSSPKDSENEI